MTFPFLSVIIFTPIVAGVIVTQFTRGTGMRIAYAIVVVLFTSAAILRSRLKETIKDAPKITLR